MLLSRLSLHFLAFFIFTLLAKPELDASFTLKENLKKASNGDYIVTMQNKTTTLFRIQKEDEKLYIEEISIPFSAIKEQRCSFALWFQKGAPHASSRILYEIDLISGEVKKSFAFTNGRWFQKPLSNPFLSTLLNIPLTEIPLSERKKTAASLWEPKLIFQGNLIENIHFTSYLAKWPSDKSELSGKTIEIYVPDESSLYPSYLPYWLEVSGTVGSTKIRIIDSGKNLKSLTKNPLN